MISHDPFLWQSIIKAKKEDKRCIPTEVLPIHSYLVSLHENTLEAALIAAYRDHSSEWLEAFKKMFFDSFIDPDKCPQIEQDVRAEVSYYRNLVKELKLPTTIKQLTLF